MKKMGAIFPHLPRVFFASPLVDVSTLDIGRYNMA